KVTTAPMSPRPRVRSAVSAAASKSSCWTRMRGRAATVSPPGHRREQGNLPRAGDGLGMVGVFLVDGDADRLWITQRLRIALATRGQPVEQVAGRHHAFRQLDLLLGEADPLAHPGEIFQLHRALFLDDVLQPRAEIVV